jgi:hypothetical protein
MAFHPFRPVGNRKRFRFIFWNQPDSGQFKLSSKRISDFPGNVNNNLDFSHLWAEKRKIIKVFGVWHIDKGPVFHLE